MEEDYFIYGNEYEGGINIPKSYLFKPKEDITTFELAQCLSFMFLNREIYENETVLNQPFMRNFEEV